MLDLTLFSIYSTYGELIQRFVVGLVALAVFGHLICIANFMPPSAPVAVWWPIPCGVSAAIGTVHASLCSNASNVIWFFCAMAASIVACNLAMWFHGYCISGFAHQKPDPRQAREKF